MINEEADIVYEAVINLKERYGDEDLSPNERLRLLQEEIKKLREGEDE